MDTKESSLSSFCEIFGVDKQLAAKLLREHQNYYSIFCIPKRRGGVRRILTPKEPLKLIQKKIQTEFLNKFSASENCHSYARSRSIITNANVHLGRDYLAKLDIQDFFSSITQDMVQDALITAIKTLNQKNALAPQISISLASVLAKICTYDGYLPQGAPTSPSLSNFVFWFIDREIDEVCTRRMINYTRYSDDLCFSSDYRIGKGFIKSIKNILANRGFQVNLSKTCNIGPNQDKFVTGLLLAETQVRLPKSRRREIRSSFFNFRKNNNSDTAAHRASLVGKLNYWASIEPNNQEPKVMISRIRAIPLKNDQEVFRLCRLAAEKGDAKAQYNLAVMYSKGTGVAKDDQEGMKWYRAAAEQGNAAAQFYLGTICEKALEVAQNNQEAKVWGHAFGSSNPFYK